MEQDLWQKVQRVSWKDLIHICFFIVAFPISLLYRRFRKSLWLICDNENEARDNGYWLFQYIVENHPKQDVVYAINKKSPDYPKVKKLGQVIQYGSLMHWIYYLTAKKNISSQKGGKPNAALCYLLEVYGILKNTRVFLQHGIIKDDLPFLHYSNTKMRMFVCSTKREWEYVSQNYGYPEGWVKCLGLCRLDQLHNLPPAKRQILVMPTWRNWIGLPTSESYKYENIDSFTNTEYFKFWNAFLKEERMLEMLQKENITLVFYPHREMQRFIGEFGIHNANIVVARWPEYDVQQLLKESAFLVTDYSSVAMDFAYMRKPLVYYQFDYEMFRNGHYPEGYFSYEEDGFGKVCYDLETLMEEVHKTIEHNFQNETLYLVREKEFFTLYDMNNSKRNYEAIKEL